MRFSGYLMLEFLLALAVAASATADEPLAEVRVGEGVILTTQPADEMPIAVRLERPAAAPLAPIRPGESRFSTTMAAEEKSKPTQRLLSERAMVVDRVGWMSRNERGAWIFEFAVLPTDALPLAPLELLPTQMLAGMEQHVEAKAPARVTFRVSGEVTNYRDRRFLLVRKALIEEMPEAAPADQTMPAATQPAEAQRGPLADTDAANAADSGEQE